MKRAMRSKGPSPLVPSLMVGVLGLVIFGPSLLSILDFVLPLFQAGDSDGGSFYVLMVLCFFYYWSLCSCFQRSSPLYACFPLLQFNEQVALPLMMGLDWELYF
ncbi:hypothetical protein CRYUN_Cryun16bG0044400 [Craigia yunnanensis]